MNNYLNHKRTADGKYKVMIRTTIITNEFK